MAQERIGNLGYCALAPETTIGTAVTPGDFTLLMDETMTTNYNLQDQAPAYGNKAETYAVLPGLRDHKGDVTVVAEPNTLTYLIDALFTRGTVVTNYTFTVTSANATVGATFTNNGVTFTVLATIAGSTTLLASSTTGAPTASGTLTKTSGTGDATITFSAAVASPYNWPFTANGFSKSYTMDVSLGNVVKRFVGVQVSKLTPTWNKNELNVKASMSALMSFQGVQISSVTGAGPYTVTVDNTYGIDLTKLLVVGDLIRFFHAPGTTIDATVATIVDATHFTTSTNVSTMISGDAVHLRPATIALNNLQTFLWSNTQFCFGSTAALAAVATQTRVEQGSVWELDHNFESDSGSQRSGSADPAALIRTTVNAALTIKKFFDTPDEVQQFNQQTKRAIVINHYAGANNQYNFQITMNNIKTDVVVPMIKPKAVNYSNIKFHPQYDQTDGQMLSVLMVNGLATIT